MKEDKKAFNILACSTVTEQKVTQNLHKHTSCRLMFSCAQPLLQTDKTMTSVKTSLLFVVLALCLNLHSIFVSLNDRPCLRLNYFFFHNKDRSFFKYLMGFWLKKKGCTKHKHSDSFP